MDEDTDLVDTHLSIVGLLSLAIGFLAALAAKLSLVFGFLPMVLEGLETPAWLAARGWPPALVATAALLVLVYALTSLSAGVALLRRRTWGRPLGIAMGVLNLPLFPVGTLFGAYALWTVTRPESRVLLCEPRAKQPSPTPA